MMAAPQEELGGQGPQLPPWLEEVGQSEQRSISYI